MPRRKPKDLDRSADLPNDWIARHIARIEHVVGIEPIDLSTWDYRHARLIGAETYEYLDDG